MKKCFNFILICFIITQSGFSQQSPKLNDYPYFYSSNEYYSKYLLNPSYTGYSKQHEFQFSTFDQLVGLANGVNSKTLSYNGFFDRINSGIGLSVSAESYGDFDKRHEISGLYSYQILKSSNLSLALGTKLGLSGRKIVDEMVEIDGKSLIGSGNWLNSPIMDLGLALNYSRFNIGITYKNLIENKIKFQNYETVLYSNGFIIDLTYEFKPTDKLIIKPYFIDYYYKQNSFSMGLMGDINNKFFTGFGYDTYYKKINATIAISFLKYFQIGYLYENENKYAFNELILKIKIKPSSQ